jgi:HPt (histidine-containing phosphotransfer) domain-containing protein
MEEKKLLNTDFGLNMLGGDTSLYKLLIDSFLIESPFDEKKLDSLISEGKTEEAGSYIHRCKGAAGQIGAERLHSAGQLFEDVLKGRKAGNVQFLRDQFICVYRETEKVLTQYRTQI